MKPVLVSSFYVYATGWLVSFMHLINFFATASAGEPTLAGINAIGTIFWFFYPIHVARKFEVKKIEVIRESDD